MENQPQYHLEDLRDNAYVEMIGEIRQFVANANPDDANYDAVEELYGSMFDQMAWDFMWDVVRGDK